MTNREVATKELLHFIDRILPGSENVNIYKERLSRMSDTQFAAYMKRLGSEEEMLYFYAPNNSQKEITVEHLLKVGDEIDYDFFHHLILTDQSTGIQYRTPVKHLVLDLPLRRQVQMRSKKTSIPENNMVVDERSGQPAHESKGSSISYPEVQILSARGLDNTIEEYLKVRGGDEKAMNVINRSIADTGGASLQELKFYPSKVKAVSTTSSYLTGMHLKNNL